MAEGKDRLWVVEVRKDMELPFARTKPMHSEWWRIAECNDSETAIAITDALHSLNDHISDTLQVRTHVTTHGR